MKKIGRPIKYDSQAALNAAMKLFWVKGYNNTSLDDLVEATNMNRPSLSAAFGSKKQIYIKAAKNFIANYGDKLSYALSDKDIYSAINKAFEVASATYFNEEKSALGCYIMSTAPSETYFPEIRELLEGTIKELDDIIIKRFEIAKKNGQISESANPMVLGKFLTSIIHSLSLRIRAGNNFDDIKDYCEEMSEAIYKMSQI